MNKTLISQLKRYYRHVRRIIPKDYPHRQEILSSIYHFYCSVSIMWHDLSCLLGFGTYYC